MIIFIYGDDTFRAREKEHQMKTAFAEKFDPTGLNTAVFPQNDSQSFSEAEVLQAVCSYPFLGKRRMILIHDLIKQTKKAEQSVWIDGFTRMPETSIVVFCETEGVKAIEKKPLFLALSKTSDVHLYAFEELQGAGLNKWVLDRVQAFGGMIDRSALQMLIERVGGNLWQLNQEIQKLVAFTNGDTITQSIVETLVHASFEGQVFSLMDAISHKHAKDTLKLLENERSYGSDDHYLLTMLGRQVRILLSARVYLEENPRANKQDLATALEIHPFVAQKVLQQARLFSAQVLQEVHRFLYDSDTQIKTGKLSADLAVDLTIGKLLA